MIKAVGIIPNKFTSRKRAVNEIDVNYDKLISILRENVNDAIILYLIRAYLRARVLDKRFIKSTTIGTPQREPISVILPNIYLDKFDKELETRRLRFVRYANDCIIFVKSEKSAN